MTRECQEPQHWLMINALMRQAILAVQEVMGEQGLNIVLREAGLERFIGNPPPDDLELGIHASEYAALNQAVTSFCGRAGRGMLQRIGRASFRYGVEEQAALMGLVGVGLKLMPQKTRAKFILNQMAKALMDTNPEACEIVHETPEGLVYVEYSCTLCYGQRAEQPICHLLVGSVSEAVKWATGQEYTVREISCRAMGKKACAFLVEGTV
ncbi:MAG: 4-vinyl reductase [Anaerolineae bacterium]|nr:4-vinyl reductase [Anaerolineae bacterium]